MKCTDLCAGAYKGQIEECLYIKGKIQALQNPEFFVELIGAASRSRNHIELIVKVNAQTDHVVEALGR
jgi:hypothetical protein